MMPLDERLQQPVKIAVGMGGASYTKCESGLTGSPGKDTGQDSGHPRVLQTDDTATSKGDKITLVVTLCGYSSIHTSGGS
jgi:hypothetical protein